MDEALLRWKQEIRDQVEEDLEYQVQLRLQLNPLYHKQHPTTVYPHLLKLQKGVATSSDNKRARSTLKESKELYHSHQAKMIISNGTEHSKYIGIQGKSKNVKGEEAQTKKARKGEEAKSSSHVLSRVFSYVNGKYGVARSQLKHLVEDGNYKTITIDSSGVGYGPNIKCPVESNLCLATPHHGVLELSKNADLEDIPEMTSLSSSITRDELVYSSSDGIATPSIVGLEFESRFESGNLLQAFQLAPREYVLWLAPDLYSEKHTQWFYFRVKGMVSNESYIFHIANFYKSDSLYNYGMHPLLYSEKMAEEHGKGWIRIGHRISYHATNPRHILSENQGKRSFYTLTWTMKFPASEDTCYLAHCFPYTYSHLLSHLSQLEESSLTSRYLRKEILCHTIAGNPCPLLTITDFEKNDDNTRIGVVITARVHPGETNSSWIMQGLIEFLTSELPHAKNLRSCYVFKIVPMLNPDGVIVGNYRTSLSAVDLNRVYKAPRADLFPTIYHTKVMIKKFMKERNVLLYVDLHGHSRKRNVFMYGCHTPHCDHSQLLKERVFPLLLSQQAPQMFDFGSCKFCISRCKEATGRVVTWKMGVENSFTMESSFHGSTLVDDKHHFSIENLLCLGKKLAVSMHYHHQYLVDESYKTKVDSKIAEIMVAKCTSNSLLPQIIHQDDKRSGSKVHLHKSFLTQFMRMNVKFLEQESSTSGSDSENDEFLWKAKKKRTKKSVMENGCQKQPKLHSSTGKSFSAPARLCPDDSASSKQLITSWRFVNKYEHRSNGGIPIFSEERLQERKGRKQNTSCISETCSNLWKPSWPPKLEPIGENHCSSNKDTDKCTRTHYLKLPPQLAKYINEMWNS